MVLSNPSFDIIIMDLRKRYGYGACRIEQILKKRGFAINHRQIEKVLVRNDMVKPMHHITQKRCAKISSRLSIKI